MIVCPARTPARAAVEYGWTPAIAARLRFAIDEGHVR
jgi:hypothetical protein